MSSNTYLMKGGDWNPFPLNFQKLTMKKELFFSVLAVGLIFTGVVYINNAQQFGAVGHVAPAYLYPNPKLTPGKAETLVLADITKTYSGQTYSQYHRNVPASEHTAVYDEYNVPQAQRNIANGEIDHFYPMCAGASNDISNLWYQPIHNMWNGQDFGFKTKDRLETWVCSQIKAGKLDPKVAFKEITTDWVKYYLANKMQIDKPTFGTVDYDYDGDD